MIKTIIDDCDIIAEIPLKKISKRGQISGLRTLLLSGGERLNLAEQEVRVLILKPKSEGC